MDVEIALIQTFNAKIVDKFFLMHNNFANNIQITEIYIINLPEIFILYVYSE